MGFIDKSHSNQAQALPHTHGATRCWSIVSGNCFEGQVFRAIVFGNCLRAIAFGNCFEQLFRRLDQAFDQAFDQAAELSTELSSRAESYGLWTGWPVRPPGKGPRPMPNGRPSRAEQSPRPWPGGKTIRGHHEPFKSHPQQGCQGPAEQSTRPGPGGPQSRQHQPLSHPPPNRPMIKQSIAESGAMEGPVRVPAAR